MSRWRDRLPGRDWERWGVAYIAHALTGFISSCGTIIAIDQLEIALVIPFVALSALVCWRQYVEFLRRNDTPGRDLGDHIVGYGIGIGVGLLWLIAT